MLPDTPRRARMIDLSHEIKHGLVTYRGLPAPNICDYLTREASRAGDEHRPVSDAAAESRNSRREFQRIRRRPERSREFAKLRRQNVRALAHRTPFDRIEELL